MRFRPRLALFVSLFAVLFVAGETGVRLILPHADLWQLTGRAVGRNPAADWADIDAFCAYRARPGSHIRIGKTVNQHGFVSTPEMAVAKPENTIRIVFLGESSTAGSGHNLADTKTWPWRATEILRSRWSAKRIEFINGALGGYTTFESYGRLWSRIRFFEPDVIVLYHGWNELYYMQSGNPATLWRVLADGSWGFHTTDTAIRVFQPVWLDHWFRWSQLLTRLRMRFAGLVEGEVGRAQHSRVSAHGFNREGLEIFRTHLRLFREAAKVFGARLVVAKQATLIVPRLPPAQRARCRYDFHDLDHDGHVEAFAGMYRVIDEEIPPDDVIDTTSLSGVPEYFADHIHPTEVGAGKLAELMAAGLLPQLERYSR